MKKIIEQIILLIIAWMIWGLFYHFLESINIVDDKQDIFLEDRSYYQKEIWEMQDKLNEIQANTKKIAEQLEIDIIEITK
jgi:hypothetical protein